jgi:ribonuclease D
MHALPYDESKFVDRSLESVPLSWIDTTEALQVMYVKLKTEPIIAVDLEHHSFHSYNGLVSLMQISSATEDFLVDTIKLREVLQSPEYSLNILFANPVILKIFHGAESDIAWLQRDFDTFVVNMFDSFHAAKILNSPKLSLAYLLDRFLEVELDKKYQLADWRERPLSAEMVEYARKDTHYLIQLYFLIKQELSLAQFEDVLNRSNQQCTVLFQPEVVNDRSWIAVLDRFNYRFNPSQTALVKSIFYWRQDRAKVLDVSPAAIMPNAWIPRLVNAKAKSAADIRSSLKNMPDLLIAELPSLVKVLNAEIEIAVPESVPAETESVHTRFESADKEAVVVDIKKMKIERPKRTISFATSSSAAAASVFGTAAKADSKSSCAIVLGSVLKRNLPTFESHLFIVAEQKVDKKNEQAEEQDEDSFKVKEEVIKIHGSNQVVEDLKLSYGSNSSTDIIEQLRIKSNKKSFNPKPVQAVDFDTIKESILQESSSVEIFDPYKTIAPKDKKKDPFIKSLAKSSNAPRLTSTPSSGNRIATFTQKNIKN